MSITMEQEASANIQNPASGWIRVFVENNSIKYKKSNGDIEIISVGVTSEEVEDIVGNMIVGGTGIDAVYDDGANTLTINLESSTIAMITSALQTGDNISELSNDVGYQTASNVSSAISAHEAASDPHAQYETSAEAQAKVDAHANLTNNPHSVTQTQVGLSNVDNTSDINKPISTSTQLALNAKADTSSLAAVATSGSYNDLTGAPVVPSELSDLSDVSVTSPSEGDFLVYNASNSRYETGQTAASIFGCSFAEEHDDTFDSNGSSSYATYLTLTAGICEANKKYRIGVFAIWGSSTTSNDIEIEITVDEGAGEITVGEMKQEAKESGTDNQVPSSGFFYYTPTVSTSLTIRLNYRMENGNGTAYMFYAGTEWWRVEL